MLTEASHVIPRSLPGVSALNGGVLKKTPLWAKQTGSTGRPTEGRGIGYGITPPRRGKSAQRGVVCVRLHGEIRTIIKSEPVEARTTV